MPERNLCHESGCPDLCCSNLFFCGQGPVFGDVKQIEFAAEVRSLQDGVYQLGGSGDFFYLKGKCVFNSEIGCSVPKRPDACGEGFNFGGVRCNKLRIEHGLGRIKGVSAQGEIIYA